MTKESNFQCNYCLIKKILDSLSNPVCYENKDKHYMCVNEPFAKQIIGLPLEEIIEFTLFEKADNIKEKFSEGTCMEENSILENIYKLDKTDKDIFINSIHNKTQKKYRPEKIDYEKCSSFIEVYNKINFHTNNFTHQLFYKNPINYEQKSISYNSELKDTLDQEYFLSNNEENKINYNMKISNEVNNSILKSEITDDTEIHHRVKNNLQVISSLLDIQAEKFNNKGYVKDSEVLEAFKETQDRVKSISLIHEALHKSGKNNILNFSDYLEKLVRSLFQTYKIGTINISLDLDIEENIYLDMSKTMPLGLIVNEIISNSFKYAFKGKEYGEIRVKFYEENNIQNEFNNIEGIAEEKKIIRYNLTIADSGTGIPENINIENSDTFGLQLIKTLVDQIEGEFELKTDNGTEFKINFDIKHS